MKVTSVAITLAAANLVASKPHGHGHHHHHHKRDAVTVDVPGPVVIEYELDGAEIPAEQACEGIADGSFKWLDGIAPAGACSTSSAQPSSTTDIAPAAFYQTSSTGSSSSTTTVPPSPPAPPAPTASSSAPNTTPANPQSSSSGGTGLNTPFPDGVLSCDTFPSGYGPIPLTYLGFNGWTGIQDITIVGNAVTNIVNGVAGGGCEEGNMCSYACPPGYQKSQWPSVQGSSGQSVGGITCQNGKLTKTNPDYNTLCIPGVGGVTVQNTMGQQVAMCRTDYPGFESETVPLGIQPSETQPVTVPDENTYYFWESQSTSAQWYLNPAGVGTEEGCQWGSPDSNVGNYAPMNAGTGAMDGKIWLSLFPNHPTTNAILNYNVQITGPETSGICKFENGQFYDSNGPNPSGCTVSIPQGSTGQFVLYD